MLIPSASSKPTPWRGRSSCRVERGSVGAAHHHLRTRHAVLAEDPPRALCGAESREAGEAPWPLGLALATLAGVTVLVALVSEIFVESVQEAAVTSG